MRWQRAADGEFVAGSEGVQMSGCAAGWVFLDEEFEDSGLGEVVDWGVGAEDGEPGTGGGVLG